MPARSNYSRGRDTEYLARDLLILHGFQVVRSAGSHTPIDLVAWQDGGHPRLIQVKRSNSHLDETVRVTRAYRQDIEALRTISRPRGSTVELWVRTPHKGWQFYSILHSGICEVMNDGE